MTCNVMCSRFSFKYPIKKMHMPFIKCSVIDSLNLNLVTLLCLSSLVSVTSTKPHLGLGGPVALAGVLGVQTGGDR